jgi:hypothetical protein
MWWIILGFFGGYGVSIYTWPFIRTKMNGLETEAMDLRDKAKALEQQIASKL